MDNYNNSDNNMNNDNNYYRPVTPSNRNIAMCIILSIITCGIYSIYWFIVLTDEVIEIAGDREGTSGGVAFLLSIVTCGIYGYYWAYKQGDRIDFVKARNGFPGSSNNILFLILELFGFRIINLALMQDFVNKNS